MHCDFDLLPFDLKITRAHPQLIGSLCVKFHDDKYKEIAIMRHKRFFGNQYIVTLTFGCQNQQVSSLTHLESVCEVS